MTPWNRRSSVARRVGAELLSQGGLSRGGASRRQASRPPCRKGLLCRREERHDQRRGSLVTNEICFVDLIWKRRL